MLVAKQRKSRSVYCLRGMLASAVVIDTSNSSIASSAFMVFPKVKNHFSTNAEEIQV